MGEEQDKLRQMLDSAPDLSDQIANSISQIEDQTDELYDQADAIEVALMDPAEEDLVDYLENTKLPELSTDPLAEYRIVYGSTFGTKKWGPPKGNISDWVIQEGYEGSSSFPTPPEIIWTDIYEYNGVGWDDDETIVQLITDYSFGNDYLYRPLTDGASYGIYPSIDSLDLGKGYLEENKDKVDDSIDIFDRYV